MKGCFEVTNSRPRKNKSRRPKWPRVVPPLNTTNPLTNGTIVPRSASFQVTNTNPPNKSLREKTTNQPYRFTNLNRN